jgi:hypothetical protein
MRSIPDVYRKMWSIGAALRRREADADRRRLRVSTGNRRRESIHSALTGRVRANYGQRQLLLSCRKAATRLAKERASDIGPSWHFHGCPVACSFVICQRNVARSYCRRGT